MDETVAKRLHFSRMSKMTSEPHSRLEDKSVLKDQDLFRPSVTSMKDSPQKIVEEEKLPEKEATPALTQQLVSAVLNSEELLPEDKSNIIQVLAGAIGRAMNKQQEEDSGSQEREVGGIKKWQAEIDKLSNPATAAALNELLIVGEEEQEDTSAIGSIKQTS